jgi:hypothetical protein
MDKLIRMPRWSGRGKRRAFEKANELSRARRAAPADRRGRLGLGDAEGQITIRRGSTKTRSMNIKPATNGDAM